MKTAGFVLLGFLLFTLPPTLTHGAVAPRPHDSLTIRLCALQAALGTRLAHPFISTNICNPPPPPPPPAAHLTLIKIVINDDGGTATTTDFQARINGTSVSWGVVQTLSPGSYTASEDSFSGYTASAWSGDCTADGHIILTPGDDKKCTITNNDEAPTPPPPREGGGTGTGEATDTNNDENGDQENPPSEGGGGPGGGGGVGDQNGGSSGEQGGGQSGGGDPI